MNNRLKETIDFLNSLKLKHTCGDAWVLCPMSIDDTATSCICGSEKHNNKIKEFISSIVAHDYNESYPYVTFNFYFKGNICGTFKKRLQRAQLDAINNGLFLVEELPLHFSVTRELRDHFEENAARIVGIAHDKNEEVVMSIKVSEGRKSNSLFHSLLIIQELGETCFNIGAGFNKDSKKKEFSVSLSFDFIPAIARETNA